MSQDLTNQEKLEEIYQMTLENNQILHGMRSRERIANAFRIVYWLVIIGAIGGVYYFVKPIMSSFFSEKSKIETTLNQFEELRSSFPETKALNMFLNSIRGTSTATTSEQAPSETQ